MGGCGTVETLPGGISSGCTRVSQATPWPSLTHLRAFEELEGASSYTLNVLRRSSPRNHLSPLPFPNPLQAAAPLRTTTLAAYWEAESRGTVQVLAPGSAAPQACAAQATVRARLSVRQRQKGRRGWTRQ